MTKYRRNIDVDLRVIKDQYLLDPNFGNRILLVEAFTRSGQIEQLNKILEDYEEPLLNIFKQINLNNYDIHIISDGLLERFSFEQIDKYSDNSPDFGIPEYGFPDPRIDAIINFEKRNRAHIVETIYRNEENTATGNLYDTGEGHGNRQDHKSRNIALLRSPEGYFVRNFITDLIHPSSSYVEYYYRKANGPLFEGWQRFLKYRHIQGTWDYVVETGMGGATREESDLIIRLGYYGQQINERSITGLEANKSFSEIAPGKYRLTINAEDGEHEKWFRTKEEAINLIRKYSPGTRTGRNSWIEDYGSELHIQSMDINDPLTYEMIFPDRQLPRSLDTDEDSLRSNPSKFNPHPSLKNFKNTDKWYCPKCERVAPKKDLLNPDISHGDCFKPHGWLSKLKNRNWQCQYCGLEGSYAKFQKQECSYTPNICKYCGERPECAKDCRGVFYALGSDNIKIIGPGQEPPNDN